MVREDEIRVAVKESKRPSSKTYIIVLVLIAAAVAFYLLVARVDTTFFSARVSNPSEASRTSNDISSGVQDVSSDIDDIGQILGIS